MKKASEYRHHADECRKLAASMPTVEQRAQLLRMAEHWEQLADDRKALIERHPEMGREEDREEARTWRRRRTTSDPASDA